MTDSLRIDTGGKKVLINDGPEFIEFNPSDVAFVEKFYSVIAEFKAKGEEFKIKAALIDGQDEVDEDGLPKNMLARIAFTRELCEYSYNQIDFLFGAGTSKTIFGGALNLELVEQFFSGLIPFIQENRNEKLEKYKAQQSKVLK